MRAPSPNMVAAGAKALALLAAADFKQPLDPEPEAAFMDASRAVLTAASSRGQPMSEVRVDMIAPFDVHPLLVAEDLYARTTRWRWLKRRRLASEIRRIMDGMSMIEVQQLLNQRRAKLIEAKELLRWW